MSIFNELRNILKTSEGIEFLKWYAKKYHLNLSNIYWVLAMFFISNKKNKAKKIIRKFYKSINMKESNE